MDDIVEIIGQTVGDYYVPHLAGWVPAIPAAEAVVKALEAAGYEIAPKLTPDEAHRLMCYRGGFTPIG